MHAYIHARMHTMHVLVSKLRFQTTEAHRKTGDVHTYMNTYVHTYANIHVYVYIHMYTHTFIQT